MLNTTLQIYPCFDIFNLALRLSEVRVVILALKRHLLVLDAQPVDLGLSCLLLALCRSLCVFQSCLRIFDLLPRALRRMRSVHPSCCAQNEAHSELLLQLIVVDLALLPQAFEFIQVLNSHLQTECLLLQLLQ